MKKIIVSAFCSAILLSTLGGAIAQAEEINFEDNAPIEQLQSADNMLARGVINGKYYRFTAVFKGYAPNVYRGGVKVHQVKNHQGLWIGYYR